MESRPGSRNGIPSERGLQSADECEVFAGISHGEFVWKPLSTAHANGGSVQQRVMIDKAFSVPRCLRLTRMSHHSHQLLRKMMGAVPGDRVEDLSGIWGEKLFSLKKREH